MGKHIKAIAFCALLFPSLVVAQWSGPVNLSPGATSAGLNESMGSCIGVNGDIVHVVYGDRFNSTHGAIFYTRSSNAGLTWTNPVAITDLHGNAWNAAIAVNGINIHVVWRTIDTLDNHRSSHYKHSIDGGNTWGPDLQIDSPVADWPAVAVSGNHVYVANDIVTSANPYNTEIFFLQSSDNGNTWSPHQQITFADNRSEDEAIITQGADIFMSWNDKRTGQMQIFTKHSADYGVTWGPDVVVVPPFGYGTMVWMDGANVDVVAAGAPSGKYQIHLAQSSNMGTTWATDVDLTKDPLNTYYYPDMVRDGKELHVTYVKSGVGAQYLHSKKGGTSWDAPYSFGNSSITPFVAYSGCVLHIILPDSGRINYFRNPTGNGGTHCAFPTAVNTLPEEIDDVNVYPNPSEDGSITISNNSEYSSIENIQLFDINGKMIYSLDFKDKSFKETQINLEQSGIFIIAFRTSANTFYKKVIVP